MHCSISYWISSSTGQSNQIKPNLKEVWFQPCLKLIKLIKQWTRSALKGLTGSDHPYWEKIIHRECNLIETLAHDGRDGGSRASHSIHAKSLCASQFITFKTSNADILFISSIVLCILVLTISFQQLACDWFVLILF